jgi:hypothetical protein
LAFFSLQPAISATQLLQISSQSSSLTDLPAWTLKAINRRLRDLLGVGFTAVTVTALIVINFEFASFDPFNLNFRI